MGIIISCPLFQFVPQGADTGPFGLGQGLVRPHGLSKTGEQFAFRHLLQIKVALAGGLGVAVGHFQGHGVGILAPQFGHAVEDGLRIVQSGQDEIVRPVVIGGHDGLERTADDAHIVARHEVPEGKSYLAVCPNIGDDGAFMLAGFAKRILSRLPA